MTAWTAGLLLGLAGSAHCVAMCGPLALGAAAHAPAGRAAGSAIAYHAGRLLVYVLLGAAAGLLGETSASAGAGRILAALAGVLLLVLAAGAATPRWIRRLADPWTATLGQARQAAAAVGRRHPVAGQCLAGAVNGLLPCGLVYPAALAAAGLGGLLPAVVFMAGFGAGTLPALLGLSLFGACVPARRRTWFRRMTPVLLGLTGLLLIARAVGPAAHDGPAAIPAPQNAPLHGH